jgi:uncharacterized protein (TIGR03663 family)
MIIILGFALRLPKLTQRPMHTDEAVHAIKFGSLLEENDYLYDPHDYHGPTLNYFTLIPALIVSANKLSEIDETTLRIVPVLVGMFLIFGLYLLNKNLSRSFIFFAGLFTAISPAMVYYSRYYIQEMLLIFFTFGVIVSGFRYVKSRRLVWAICTGVFIGLMHATKETCIIAFGAILLALFLTLTMARQNSTLFNSARKINSWHILTVIFTAFAVSALFYSSFFTNTRGILDSLLSYKTYLQRAGHDTLHIHPWFYYFKLLISSNTEVIVVLLSGIGLAFAIKRKHYHDDDLDLLRFIAFYTVIMAVIYSIIPYKTPWSMLGFYHGMILLAAFGAKSLLMIKTTRTLHILFILFIGVGANHLFVQSYLSNFLYETDPANPYVYAHTSRDIFKITERVEEIAEVHPNGKNMFIEVICPGDDYWPVPWYLRSFPNVGFYHEVNFDAPAAPVVIASPDVEPDLLKKLYELPPPGQKNLYLPLLKSYTELRPHIEIRGYVVKDLMDRYLQNKDNKY